MNKYQQPQQQHELNREEKKNTHFFHEKNDRERETVKLGTLPVDRQMYILHSHETHRVRKREREEELCLQLTEPKQTKRKIIKIRVMQ